MSSQFSGQKQVLKNINIHILKNQCIAIVCESGNEKSTLSQIIQKLCVYENGNVTINNHISLNEVNTKDWYTIIGVVQKEVKIYPSHVLDNIILEEHVISNKTHVFEGIDAFIQEYGFEDFIQSLP